MSTLHLFDPVTLTFNLLNSNKMDDQELSCTTHLLSLVMAVAVLGKKYYGGLAPHHLGGNNG